MNKCGHTMDLAEPRALLAEVRLAGLTQSDVAKALVVSQGTVSKLERGKTRELRSGAFRRLVALHRRVLRAATRNPALSQTRRAAGAKES
jgi:transcriptional regulator with XRE-family HTH domain